MSASGRTVEVSVTVSANAACGGRHCTGNVHCGDEL